MHSRRVNPLCILQGVPHTPTRTALGADRRPRGKGVILLKIKAFLERSARVTVSVGKAALELAADRKSWRHGASGTRGGAGCRPGSGCQSERGEAHGIEDHDSIRRGVLHDGCRCV